MSNSFPWPDPPDREQIVVRTRPENGESAREVVILASEGEQLGAIRRAHEDERS